MVNLKRYTRHGAAITALAVASTVMGCDSLMQVENPGTIDDAALTNEELIPLLVNSAVAEFQRDHSRVAKTGAIFTDELVTGHNFRTIQSMDERRLDPGNSTMDSRVYGPIQRARHTAEDASRRLRELLDGANSDLRLARTLAYGGYSYIFLGEYFCEAPIANEEFPNGSPMMPWQDHTQTALDRFDEVIAVASAARDAGENAAEAERLINLARVGAARAALQLERNDDAVRFASEVPEGFEFWVRHSDNTTYQSNRYWGSVTGSNHNIGVHERFRFLDDPRVQHFDEGRTGHNQSTVLFTPYQSWSFEDWNGNEPVEFERGTDMRLASGLEARYIVAEGRGAVPATRDLVNERRAVGGQDPVDLSGDDLLAELREQRARDLYLAGYRLGDLRRYKATGQGDFWPRGEHENPEFLSYGDDECFIVTQAEIDGNPNL